jgi:hypothetical protein
VGGERAVAGPVCLEVAPGRVDGVAVELGHESVVGPGGVDAWFVAVCELDPMVRSRPGKAVGGEEGEERDFELGTGDGAADVALPPRIGLSVAIPRRPGCRATRAAREVGLVRRLISASAIAASNCCLLSSWARSKSVRAGVVTGIPR